MNASILCTLLAQRIPPEQFQVHGEEVVFFDPEKNNKPVGNPNESPYDTPENRAIVADVIANYDTLAAAYQAVTDYIALRRAEYPPMADYLDGIVKGDKAQVQKYIADCLAVKAKHPKP